MPQNGAQWAIRIVVVTLHRGSFPPGLDLGKQTKPLKDGTRSWHSKVIYTVI